MAIAEISILNNEKIEVFSLKGDKILDKKVINSNSLKLDLESGVYLLKISNNSRVVNSKIIIK